MLYVGMSPINVCHKYSHLSKRVIFMFASAALLTQSVESIDVLVHRYFPRCVLFSLFVII